MRDLISRKAAIDAVNEYLRLSAMNKTVEGMTSIQAVLEWLPPIEDVSEYRYDHVPSAYTDEQIQKMQDLEQAEIEKAYELGRQSQTDDITYCSTGIDECLVVRCERHPSHIKDDEPHWFARLYNTEDCPIYRAKMGEDNAKDNADQV